MNKRSFKQFAVKLLIIFSYLGIIAVLYFLEVPCLFQHLFHIPCLGCGMTRALISAIQLDFVAAFRYHPMFWSLPFIGLYLIANGNLFGKKMDRIILVAILVGFLINWIMKMVPILSAW